MLNEHTAEIASPHSAQMRARREEFACAIASLEARRQGGAESWPGTVAVEDTLRGLQRDLQVDVSAEEVMEQIEAQRAGYAAQEEPRRVWDPDKITDFKLVSAIVLVPPLAVLLWARLFLLAGHHPAVPPSAAVQTRGAAATAPLWVPPPMMPPGVIQQPVDEGGFNASSVLKPLAQVPDDQPVHCNTTGLETLLSAFARQQLDRPYDPLRPTGALDPKALAQSSQFFDVRPTLRKPWVLIKHDGRLYLRAWVAAKFTEAQAEGSVVTLHSSPKSFDPGVRPLPITVPLPFRFDFNPSASFQFGHPTPPTLNAIQVSLDKHAWEKW